MVIKSTTVQKHFLPISCTNQWSKKYTRVLFLPRYGAALRPYAYKAKQYTLDLLFAESETILLADNCDQLLRTDEHHDAVRFY